MTPPRDIDYTNIPLGKSVRLPRGKIAKCSHCGRRGLRLVFSFRRGRYEIAYWHTAVHDTPGFAPLALDSCTVRARSLAELPKAERDKS